MGAQRILCVSLLTITSSCIAFIAPTACIRNVNFSFRTSLQESNDLNDDAHQYFSPNAELKDFIQVDDDSVSSLKKSSIEADTFNEYSFFDEATIFVRAGSGGQGASTYRKGPGGQQAQPDGGDGGKGGDVILCADESLNTLAGLTRAWRPNSFGGGGAATTTMSFRPMSFRAENGKDGERKYRSGRYGKEVIIRVPSGTVVQEEIDEFEVDKETGQKIVLSTKLVDIGIVTADYDFKKNMIIAIGGEGGEGSSNQGYKKGRGVRRTRSPPVGGERKRLKLTLKVRAHRVRRVFFVLSHRSYVFDFCHVDIMHSNLDRRRCRVGGGA